MVLRLHVWGPAVGLASIDAECLSTITYLAYAVPTADWELVATSPSGVPAHSLPALHDTNAGGWTVGFTAIAATLGKLNPAWDLDASLSPSQRADSTAYTTFLAGTAAPLLALSLYVSSANWAATTRPAYSAVLPFPLTWTEPSAVRARMCDVAEHLGLSDLNIDAAEPEDKARLADQDARGGFLKIPERLRPRRTAGVRAALSPEQTSLFRLEATARECLGVLADLKGQHEDEGLEEAAEAGRFFLGGDKPTALDCLAFGYLALMLVPEVPRPWLADVLRRRYECLCVFVDGVRDKLFGGDVSAASSLPWHHTEPSTPWTATRFARGVVRAAVPEDWVVGGGEWSSSTTDDKGKGESWALQERRSRVGGGGGGGGALSTLGSSVAGLGLVGGVLLYRHLSPFGSVFYRWEMQRTSLGAAGAFFGI